MSSQRQRLFCQEALTRYPASISTDRLRHKYSKGRKSIAGREIDFRRVALLHDGLKQEVDGWYWRKTGKKFNPYELGDMTDPTRQRYWSDERFAQIFELLGIDPAHMAKALIPWWNELAATELGHDFDGNNILVTLAPRLGLETQIARAGVDLGISSVSVGGVIRSADGNLAIGLRAGATYPNTYHINAGALGLSDELMREEMSIFDFYRRDELQAEFGLEEGDLLGVTVHARLVDFAIDNGPMYIFSVMTDLTFDELETRYEENKDEDKGEHTRLVAIRDDPNSIMDFISRHYRGMVSNKDGRGDDERYLLHPGALALLSFTNQPLSELGRLCREGSW